MKQHLARTAAACFYHIRRLRQIRRRVGQEVTQQLVLVLLMPSLDYCNSVLAGLPMSTLKPLQHVQNAAIRLEFGLGRSACPPPAAAGCQSLAPFTNRVVSHFLVQTVPFLLLDTLARFFHVRDPVVLVHTLL